MSRLAGLMLYRCYHRPVGFVRELVREGGPLEQRRTARGRAQMALAARALVPPRAPAGTPLRLHLLTGNKFWYQTAFCLWTLARHAHRPLAPVVYDDSTLLDWQWEALSRLFPAARLVCYESALARLDAALPAGRYPFLHERWLQYPNIRKLVDPHLDAGPAWKLVLDSDLLFFRRPDFLLDWVDRPMRPLHAEDCDSAYGYARPELDALAGRPLADRVNVGLCGLRTDEVDWDQLEHWCRTLIERHGTHYYLEQALVAMLVAGETCAVAPAADYVTLPRPPEANTCTAAMHHYVAESKRWYFQQNWRTALRCAESTNAAARS